MCPAGDPGPAAGKDGSRMLRREAGAEIRGGAGGAHSGQVCCVCVCIFWADQQSFKKMQDIDPAVKVSRQAPCISVSNTKN